MCDCVPPNIFSLSSETEKPLKNPSSLSLSDVLHSHSHCPKMQTSLTLLPFKTPLIFPTHHHNPISPKPLPSSPQPQPQHHAFSQKQTQTHVSPVNSFKGSGYISTISQAIKEEEEYRRARAEVLRKGLDLEGFSIEGLSVGGHETCVIIPDFKCAFDIGRCPSRAIQQSFVFITHAHLDHIVWPPSISSFGFGFGFASLVHNLAVVTAKVCSVLTFGLFVNIGF